ncbi:MAG: CRTAC1 family protein [Myxococcota bacterium]|nr:CRTAC1 family protein [Myxococcota bacterium]
MRALILMLILPSCSSTSGDPPSETGSPSDTAPTVEACGSASGTIPEGLTTLSWDNTDSPNLTIFDFLWEFSGYQDTYQTWKEVQYEAVRFDLEHPVRIHGFSIQWSHLDAEEAPPLLEAGLYPDFGHNGFDFDANNPIWSGTRCLEDVGTEEWTSYALEEPLLVSQPGLVYVAHKKKDENSPVWLIDSDTQADGDCTDFDACHSAWNFPELETNSHYNGWSFPFPYDYRVRLHVEYIEDLAPEEKRFAATDLSLASRSAWGDFDADGWDDLMTPGLVLYRNQGDGTFIDVTEAAGLTGVAAASGGVWGDFDNDGCLDFFAMSETYTTPDALLRNNCDGTFVDVTASSGIEDLQTEISCTGLEEERSPTAAAAWWDYNSDGLLDLYMGNMMCWDSWTSYRDVVFRNAGNGQFVEVSGSDGFSRSRYSTRGATPADANGDGHTDLMVNNYTLHPNLYFQGTGTAEVNEQAKEAGLEGQANYSGTTRYYGHTIGTAWGDLDNDGDLDMVHANLSHPRFYHFSDRSMVLLNDGSGHFEDISDRAQLRYQETHSSPVLADFDNDSVLDLVLTAVYPGRPTDFYWGNGDGSFDLDVYRAGITTENGWGAAAADFDHDGDVDLATYTLFENQSTSGEWLAVQAIGNVASNRAAIGATVRVYADQLLLTRHVQGGSGQGCQDSQSLHFGLGFVTEVDAIEVDFPGGGTVRYDGPFASGQKLWLYEDGHTSSGWER